MPRRRPGEPASLGIAPLLQQGVPVGAFALPNLFHQASSAGKLHADQYCSRLRAIATVKVRVRPATVDESTLCSTCVHQPTNLVTRRYLAQAQRALKARDNLDEVAGSLATDTSVTWDLVTKARAAATALTGILAAPELHEDMATFVGPILARATALHADLLKRVERGTDAGAVTRACLVDNLGTPPQSGGPDQIAPPVPQRSYASGQTEPLPALMGGWSGPAGHSGLIAKAWTAWARQVKADSDLNAARAAAEAAGVPDPGDAPGRIDQLPKGPARVDHYPDASPWQRMIAEWRHAVVGEITDLVTLWERRYADAVTAAEHATGKVLLIQGFDRDTLATANASTQILHRLDVAGDPDKKIALVLASAPAAAWLVRFGVKANATRFGSDVSGISVLADALPGDNGDVLRLAVRLWQPAGTSGAAMLTISDALTTARGIMAPAAA